MKTLLIVPDMTTNERKTQLWGDLLELVKTRSKPRNHKCEYRDRREYQRNYYRSNRELHRRTMLRWLKRHPDYMKLYMRDWRRGIKRKAA